jgi:hypothetical protein
MLNNDMVHEWMADPDLGKRIMRSSHTDVRYPGSVLNYGKVVECCHADNQTLAMLGHYTQFNIIGGQSWKRDESDADSMVRLLKYAAGKLGYRLVRQQAA